MKFLTFCVLIERVRTISHRVTQKNRTPGFHRDIKSTDNTERYSQVKPHPQPLSEWRGEWSPRYPSFAACVLMGILIHSDASLANHQHLTLNIQHLSLAVTFCDICMPKAFCGIETVRKNVLLNLCALWEKEIPSVRKKNILHERRNSPTYYMRLIS